MVDLHKVTKISLYASLFVLLGVVPVVAFIVGTQYGLTILTLQDIQDSALNTVTPSNAQLHATSTATGTLTQSAEHKNILSQVQKKIAGTWQSIQDGKYVVIFYKSGDLREEYRDPTITGDPTVDKGTWKLLGEFQLADLQLNTTNEDGAFLKKIFEDGHTFNYKVLQVSTSTLQLMYLDSGRVNTFTKIK